MHTITQIKPIQDLTYGQQKMLRIILKLPQKPFQTSDILSISHDFDDNLAASAVIGSLSKLGYLQKMAGGRDKRWCVDQAILRQRDQFMRELSAMTIENRINTPEKYPSTSDALSRLLAK